MEGRLRETKEKPRNARARTSKTFVNCFEPSSGLWKQSVIEFPTCTAPHPILGGREIDHLVQKISTTFICGCHSFEKPPIHSSRNC
jgi:hypothetical protein